MTEQEKIALSETQRAFVTPIVGGITGGAVAYGLPAALEKIREVRVRRNRDSYITAMKDVHPDLKGIPKKDLHIAYNSLAMHSPHVLRDPLLGGQELLRMSRYRQADINSLNEMNKLRGNSMMDQAFMNATNMVAGGVTEGFKGYQAQRMADQDQAYREKMDKARAKMDEERMKFERERFGEQKRQFGVTSGQADKSHQQREDHFEATFNQRENQLNNDDAYRADRDAVADAKWQAEQGIREAKNTREEISFGRSFTEMREALDAQGYPMYDSQGNQLYHSYQPGGNAGRDAVEYHTPFANTRTYPGTKGTPRARKPSKYTKKTASATELVDIVARLRDRNF